MVRGVFEVLRDPKASIEVQEYQARGDREGVGIDQEMRISAE